LEIAAFIGLDWADQHHVIRLRAAGSAQIEARVLDQKPESLGTDTFVVRDGKIVVQSFAGKITLKR
jgi:hypothetical protein